MAAGVVLTEEAYQRMVNAIRWVEQQRGLTQKAATVEGGVDPVYVRTTSGTKDGDGNYPGVVCLYSAATGDWFEYSAVKLRPVNGETLANSMRYPARPAGRTASGDELYTVHQLIGTTITVGSYTGVHTINLQSYMLVDDSPSPPGGGGIVLIGVDLATELADGLVSGGGGWQCFDGVKGFADWVYPLNGLRIGIPESLRAPGDPAPDCAWQLEANTFGNELNFSKKVAGTAPFYYGIHPIAKLSYYHDTPGAGPTTDDAPDATQWDIYAANSAYNYIRLRADADGSHIRIDTYTGITGTHEGLTIYGGVVVGTAAGSYFTGTVP